MEGDKEDVFLKMKIQLSQNFFAKNAFAFTSFFEKYFTDF
jgi:hypothetical protein